MLLQQCLPFTVLKPMHLPLNLRPFLLIVATVLTVYGIETGPRLPIFLVLLLALQQCLPFTVLKLTNFCG